ncbi:hypothetical protein Hanom_Chr12g01113931 [Helianthus anomalus]
MGPTRRDLGQTLLNSCSPPIPQSLWLTITHYLTDGPFMVIRNSRKLYEIRVGNNPLECYYASSWFRGYIGAVFQQTLVSPNA